MNACKYVSHTTMNYVFLFMWHLRVDYIVKNYDDSIVCTF